MKINSHIFEGYLGLGLMWLIILVCSFMFWILTFIIGIDILTSGMKWGTFSSAIVVGICLGLVLLARVGINETTGDNTYE